MIHIMHILIRHEITIYGGKVGIQEGHPKFQYFRGVQNVVFFRILPPTLTSSSTHQHFNTKHLKNADKYQRCMK